MDQDGLLVRYKTPLILLVVAIFFILVGIRVFSYRESQQKLIEIVEPYESSSSASLVVYIAGSVEKPGVYTLSSGSRVQDLLVASGGLTADADRAWVEKNINLAQKVTDGGKIYIPAVGENQQPQMGDVKAEKSETIGSTVNINSAASSELESLPGIGEVTASKIIVGRPYQSIEELLEKKIVGKSVFEKIREKISI